MDLSRPNRAPRGAPRRTARALPIAIALLFGGAGCRAPADRAADATEVEKTRTIVAAQRAVARAHAKLELLAFEQAEEQAQRDAAIIAAQRAESAASRARLAHQERAAPLARAEAEHALEESRTDVHDAEEELAQLKLMYAEQDLADATRELVLARSERRHDAAQKAVELEERRLALLVDIEQPAAADALAEALFEKAEEHRAARQDDALAKRAAALARMEAEQSLAEAEEELAEAMEGFREAIGDGERAP